MNDASLGFDLKIKPIGFAEQMLQSEHFDAVVSIGSPGARIPKGFERVPLRLRLEIEDLYKVEKIHKYRMQGKRAPGREDVERIIEFARRLKGTERLMVHCWAGISRSSAAAWIILYVRSGPGSEQACLDRVLEVRSVAHPNKIMMAYADEILGARFLETMNTSLGGLYLPS